jgi:hypothetical protein
MRQSGLREKAHLARAPIAPVPAGGAAIAGEFVTAVAAT